MSTLITTNRALKSLRNTKSQRNSLTRTKKEDKGSKSFLGIKNDDKKTNLKKKKNKVKKLKDKKINNSTIKEKKEIDKDSNLKNLSSINSL